MVRHRLWRCPAMSYTSDRRLAQTFKKMKWNESGFRPPLCTYRLNWARRTSWGWWDDWDDTVLQTQDSKFEPWRSEAEHATSRSRRLPTILTFTRGWGRNNFVSFKPPKPGTEPRTLAWKAAVLTTTLGPPPHRLSESMCLPSPTHEMMTVYKYIPDDKIRPFTVSAAVIWRGRWHNHCLFWASRIRLTIRNNSGSLSRLLCG